MYLIIISSLIGFAPPKYVANDLNQYIDLFKREAIKRNKSVNINDTTITFSVLNMKPSNNPLIGYCDWDKHIVFIDLIYWEEFNQFEKEALVFHELGHCMLNRNHVKNYKSIMNVGIIKDYDTRREEYLNELFGGK